MAGSLKMDGAGEDSPVVRRRAGAFRVRHFQARRRGPTPIGRRRRYIEGHINMPHRFEAERSFEDEPGGVIG
jgi:hypothetical protein